MSYAWQKLYEAVGSLATSALPLQRRLGYATIPLLVLKPDDFPDAGNLEDFTWIMEQIRAPGESIAVACGQLTDIDAEAVAKRIWTLFNRHVETLDVADPAP
jgi:hypothetical protein